MPANNLIFQVQTLSSAGPDRVSVTFTQVNTNDAGAPFYGANFNLNLSQDEATEYEINARYSLSLSKVTETAKGSTGKTA